MKRDIQNKIDQEIMNTLGIGSEFSDKSGSDVISDLNDMICKMTTVMVCSENDKERLEKQELPPMTKIIPNKCLEDGTVYLIKDENTKRAALGMEAKYDFSEFPFWKEVINLKVFVTGRKDRYSYGDNYKAVVVAEDELHAERLARWKIDGFKKAKLEVKEVDLNAGEQILSVENVGA